jgi:RNA polymerase sigma-70 factor (ECF subfamily)
MSYNQRADTPPRTAGVTSSSEAEVVDRTLLGRILHQDADALAVFYDRWSSTVRALVARIVGEPADTDEVVEEVFWQIWQQADRFDGERGRVAVWLLTIARSRALDRVRARKRRRDDVPETRDDGTSRLDHVAADDAALDPGEFADQRMRVATALSVLPAEQREVVMLAYFAGLSQSEIAEQLTVPLGTVKTRTRLAFGKLRDTLATLWDDEP